MQIVKTGLKRNQSGTFRTRLSQTLMSYRLTPQSTTGKSPCELMFRRRICSRLDFLRPNTADKVEQQLTRQKQDHSNCTHVREFSDGSLVFVRNPHAGDKWIRGVVLSSQGNVSYSVKLENGRIRKCHIDQLRSRPSDLSSSPVTTPIANPRAIPFESVTEPPETIVQSNEPPRIVVEHSVPTEVPRKEYPKRNRSNV